MKLTKLILAAVGLAVGVGGVAVSVPASAADQYIPSMVYRSGPYAPNGIPFADGYADYLNMLNERDGGINGVKIQVEECDTSYDTNKGIECYEKMKGKGGVGASVFSPLSTGITYAITERATADKIPVFSMGYGRAAATVGSTFPYVFTAPVTYWAGADSIITYIAGKEGGFGKLKGKKIALIYHDSAYGKEPISTLEKLAALHGFEFSKFAVAHPGLEQKATWLQIGRQLKPNWTIMWGWGVMNQTAIKEAAAVGFPMDHFIGVWWSGSEQDVRPAGAAAKGYTSAQFHGAGAEYQVHKDIFKTLYDKGKGSAKREAVGEILYNRGMINAIIVVEAIRTAMGKFGNKPMSGEQVQWGFENLNITEDTLKKLGLTGLMAPLQLACNDHEGSGKVMMQQWDGAKWKQVSDWSLPHNDMLRPMYEESAAQYAKEKKITPRKCS